MSRRKLRPAELRLLYELAARSDKKGWDGVWYFPAKNLRTLRSLASLGLAKHHESFGGRHGYSITAAGSLALETGMTA